MASVSKSDNCNQSSTLQLMKKHKKFLRYHPVREKNMNPTPVENDLSSDIIGFHLNRTPVGTSLKNRQPKLLLHSPVDDDDN